MFAIGAEPRFSRNFRRLRPAGTDVPWSADGRSRRRGSPRPAGALCPIAHKRLLCAWPMPGRTRSFPPRPAETDIWLDEAPVFNRAAVGVQSFPHPRSAAVRRGCLEQVLGSSQPRGSPGRMKRAPSVTGRTIDFHKKILVFQSLSILIAGAGRRRPGCPSTSRCGSDGRLWYALA